MDNVLCNHVSRSSFCAEQHGNRLFRKLACLDLQILMDDIEGIHLLAFVFMQTFYLNVKNGIRVQFQSLGVLQIGNKLSLLFCFHIQKLCKYGRVRHELSQFFQFHGIFLPAFSDERGDEGGKLRVAGHEPAAEGDAVGLIVEALRVQFVEVVQFCVL